MKGAREEDLIGPGRGPVHTGPVGPSEETPGVTEDRRELGFHDGEGSAGWRQAPKEQNWPVVQPLPPHPLHVAGAVDAPADHIQHPCPPPMLCSWH
jgi:hypothetical protein